MKKSVLALILAVLMAVGLLTIGAAADGTVCTDEDCNHVAAIDDTHYDSLAAAVTAAQNGDTIVVLQNVDISATGLTIPAEKSLTLDINGKEIEVANTNTGRILVYGKLIIKDSTDINKDGTGTGKIYSNTRYSDGGTTSLIVSHGEDALVTLESGYVYAVIEDETAAQGQFGLGVWAGGDLTVTGGKVEAGWYAISGNGTNNTQNSVINISGGILISTADYAVYLPQSGTTNITGGTIYGAAGGVCSQRGELNISGDVLITSKGTGDTGNWGDGTGGLDNAALYVNAKYGECDVAISGGEFTAEGDAVSIATGAKYAEGSVIEITGGTFTGDVSQFVPKGMIQGDDGEVVINEATAVAAVNDVGYTTFDDAFEAAKDGGTITLLKDIEIVNKTYTANEDITITGAKMTVERTVAGVAFEIRNDGKLTFDNLKLEINGDPDSCGKEGDAVTKGIDVYDGELVITNNSKVDFNNLRSAIVMQTAESSANIVSSLVTASNVWGNFSNGGSWHIIGSSLNIGGNKDSKGHGLSATELEIRDSSVNISSCGLLGLTAKHLDVDDSTITVNECGKLLPYMSEWSTDKESYKYPVEIQNGGSVTIDKDSTITLMNNPAGNVLYLVNSTLTADGTLNASISTNSGSECYIVSIEGFNPMVVASGNTVTLPTVSKPGYIFMGWKCSDRYTHQAGEAIKVEKNMTFTAIWANMPDITPGTPGGDDDDEPVVTFPFNDVSVLDWYYDAVKYVYDNELMNGTDVNQFSPNSPLTRAMVWAVLARVDGETISGDSWMTEAQAWAVESGVSDGTDPTGYVTREQLVTMLYRFAGEPAGAADISGYPDAASISDWAADAMAWAVKVGLIEGDDVGALNPTANSTRAHAATFFMRFCEL